MKKINIEKWASASKSQRHFAASIESKCSFKKCFLHAQSKSCFLLVHGCVLENCFPNLERSDFITHYICIFKHYEMLAFQINESLLKCFMEKDITLNQSNGIFFIQTPNRKRNAFPDYPLLLDHLSKGFTKFISANKI